MIDDEDWEKVSKFKWYLHTTSIKRGRKPYFLANVLVAGKHTTIPIHRFILDGLSQEHKDMEVDHINRDTCDNRKENLRLVSPKINGWNKEKMKTSTSPYKGVTFYKKNGTWTASYYINGENYQKTTRIHLGYFPTAEDAAHAYDKAVIKNRDEIAYTNFPRETYKESNNEQETEE